MSKKISIELKNREIVKVLGRDSRNFLQGMISNDIRKVSKNHSIYAAFLTPQGKFLNDFFIMEFKDHLLLDCEKGREDSLMERLENYKLGSDVTFQKQESYKVFALIAENFSMFNLEKKPLGSTVCFDTAVAFLDPRHERLGLRFIVPEKEGEEFFRKKGFTSATFDDYEKLRIPLGVPDGSRDIEIEKGLLMESGLNELNGIDWEKGCYLGQELTARTKFRALLKQRLIPVKSKDSCPERESEVFFQKEFAGTVRSGIGNYAIALLKIDCLKEQKRTGKSFVSQGKTLTPILPDWIKI